MSVNTYKRFRVRMSILLIMVVLVWLVIAGQLFRIQILDHYNLKHKITQQFLNKKPIKAMRGNFYDRNGRQLTQNVMHYSFAVNPNRVERPRQLAELLSKLTGESKSHFLKKINDKSKIFTYLKRNVPKQDCELLLAFQDPGLIKEPSFRRYYPYGEVAAPLIGLVGTDNKGVTGEEYYLDHELSGEDGWMVVGADGLGKARMRGEFPRQAPRDGNDVYLSLDVEMQIILEQELKNAIRRHRADGAMGILLDPNSGEILAIASLPSFNPNNLDKLPGQPLVLAPVTSAFEPGSTFKIVSAIAALEKGIVQPDETIYCENGSYPISSEVNITDWKPFQYLSFRQVIQESSNIGVIKVSNRLDPIDLFATARDFGFGERTGVSYQGESDGVLKPVKDWSGISQAEVSIGYEISVTGLQLALAYAAIANGGYLMEPVLIRYIRDHNNQFLDVDNVDVVRKVATTQAIQTLTNMLEDVVRQGTGHAANIPNLRIAGKSGTAKKLVNGMYVNQYLASFVSFFPSDNPAYVLAVIVDRPRQGGYTGGQVAAPVCHNVFSRIYNLNQDEIILNPIPESPSTSPEDHVMAANLLSSVIPVSKSSTGILQMPDVRGLSKIKALQALSAVGITPHWVGSGRVVRQVPVPGTRIASQTNCTVYLSE
ncbi:MAG: transpeptidase family protein [Lentisphaeria bacterium]|nr:transpeptidase family protein [Candidatus Neomarinimicrobiota bacterium]MCF7842882.1 transpeptidase family protein [Lentisphaeria bacterium]